MKKLCDSIQKYGFGKFAILIICFILPYVSTHAAGQHEWLGRWIALVVVFIFAVPALLWYALNPKAKYIKKGGKLNKHPKAIPVVVVLIRLSLLGIGLVLLWGSLLPLIIDTNSLLHKQRPILVDGTVVNTISPFPLLEFISQEIVLEKSGTKSSYRFYYSFRPRLRHGAKYELLVLPKSKMVLEATEIKQLEKN